MKHHDNYTAGIYKGMTPAQRACWWRKERRRSTIENGKVRGHFIEIVKPEKPKRCRWCGKEEANDYGLCVDCFHIWRTPQNRWLTT